MEESNQVCGSCGTKCPEFLCECDSAVTLLCRKCLPAHSARGTEAQHLVLLAQEYTYRKTIAYFRRLEQRIRRFPSACNALRENLSKVAACERELTQKAVSILMAVRQHLDSQTKELQSIRAQMEKDIEESVKEALWNLFEDHPKLRSKYAAAIRGGDSLTLFEYRMSSDLEMGIELEYCVRGEKLRRGRKSSADQLKQSLEVAKAQFDSTVAVLSWTIRENERNYLSEIHDLKAVIEQLTRDKLELKTRNAEIAEAFRDLSASVSSPVDIGTEVPVPTLPLVHGNTLHCMNLLTNETTTSQLSAVVPTHTVFCVIDARTVLCVGGKTATTAVYYLNLPSASLTRVAPTLTARRLPGITRVLSTVYVFGGGEDMEAITACEKFSVTTKGWTELRSMRYPRKGFSPCVFGQSIYLVDALEPHKRIEAFHMLTEDFRTLRTRIPAELTNNSVAFIVDGELVVISANEQMARWRVNTEAEMHVEKLAMKNPNSGMSSVPPVRRGRQVLWVNWLAGALVTFDVDTHKLTEQ